MPDCCCSVAPVEDQAKICPECETTGKKVQLITVKSLVRPERQGEIQEIQYYYCPTRECEVVYFSHSRRAPFYKKDLTVRVGAKETADPIPVCYCFGHTKGSIREEIGATGRTLVEEKIRAEIKAGNCICERTNPSGACCLGEVRTAIKHLMDQVLEARSLSDGQPGIRQIESRHVRNA